MKKSLLFIAHFMFVFVSSFAQSVGQNADGNFSQYLNKTIVKNITNSSQGSAITSFNNEENTVGTRFLFNDWVQGDSVINAQGVLINTTGFVFNYDKLTGSMLATQDKINNMLVSSNGIQSFVLKSMGKRYFFEHVKAIDSIHFFLSLAQSDSKYSLYKHFITTYTASDFKNLGVIQTGKEYNEYKDDNKYYVVDESNNTITQLSLKPREIKAFFASQKQEVDIYFKQHKNDEIDDRFLAGLVNSLNQ
ncbi:MAG TPA: hypothetical protein VFW07_09220 [Parafilimonas sp.]|nr:hypothetical protein [Parafilimonas sp.]